MPKIRELVSPSSSENASSEDGSRSEKKTERVLDNWIKGYLEYTKESESPVSYHLWTGLSVIASAVRRNVWIDQGLYILYPHMFVILVGPPGIVAKSTTIRLGRTLLYGIEGIKFSPDAVTVEELFNRLEASGKDSPSSALTIHSTELSDLIDPSGIKMISFLTTIYDGAVDWSYATKGSGKNEIKNPVVNLLGGTTPDWIANGLPVQAIGHGFTSRVIFVFEDRPRHLNPFPDQPDKELVKALVNDLDHISRIKGEFTWGEGTKDAYAEYYKKIYATQPPDYRVEGYYRRKKNHLLKVAMLLSLAESDSLILSPRDIHEAWELLEMVEKRMAKTFSSVGKYEYASDLERILAEIEDAGAEGMMVETILDRNYAVGDEQTIAKILITLTKMGKIVKEKDDDGVIWFRAKTRGV